MTDERFAGLTKVPNQPATRLLAIANAKLATKLECPANASVEDVLSELASAAPDADAVVDMLRLFSVALPARERTWWACVAARQMAASEGNNIPAPLATTERWVRQPNDENRQAVRDAIDAADPDDDTVLCGTSVLFFDETLGPGELAQFPGPPGASQSSSFGMVMMALSKINVDFFDGANLLIDSALDIARGGNGAIKLPQSNEETAQ